MAHVVVKILSDDNGEVREKHLQHWHLSIHKTGNQTLCQGEFYGYGESNCEYVTKTVKRGGITCPDCLRELKEYKAIKL